MFSSARSSHHDILALEPASHKLKPLNTMNQNNSSLSNSGSCAVCPGDEKDTEEARGFWRSQRSSVCFGKLFKMQMKCIDLRKYPRTLPSLLVPAWRLQGIDLLQTVSGSSGANYLSNGASADLGEATRGSQGQGCSSLVLIIPLTLSESMRSPLGEPIHLDVSSHEPRER